MDPRICRRKTGYGLASALIERGLAGPMWGQEWDAWFEVEKRTANLLMAFLTTILGQKQEQQMDPITDSADCLWMHSPGFRREAAPSRVSEGPMEPPMASGRWTATLPENQQPAAIGLALAMLPEMLAPRPCSA